ncbi:PREDICTED: SLIT and NTRK-like protein 5 [Cyprinodon variegatus]|nr:PREDICTED: SLIT and NTRK-like protein 5 [Cyprinodon variegatus]XP_015257755.1 PREDICTED: SLIT and NTRK-like protein 5 [Cyprinodon variegatus]
MVLRWDLLLLSTFLLKAGPVIGCVCPPATILSQFPSEGLASSCCLNFSGSALSHAHWSVFTNGTKAQILDLSNCNISFIYVSDKQASELQRVYLGRNRLRALPKQFLAGQPSLIEVDLSENLLEELPKDFLQDSDYLQRLDLRGNQLRSLPGDLLQIRSLERLELDENLWECSCLFLEVLEAGQQANRTTRLEDLVGNVTCSSPEHLAGRTVWSLMISDICRPAGLTALFIVLPLLILSALLLCWCCGRKRKKKETPAFSSSKKRAPSFGYNNHKQPNKPQPPGAEQGGAADSGREGILKNQLLLRPASALLGSTRDIYEEVEIKLSSVESLPPASCSSSAEGNQGSQEPNGANKTELDTVSVTEVMKDSADREKAYLTQSTEYYSLVPGIELEDSDHGEYENVNLS